MTRRTSIAAYHTIRDNGLLSKRRWQTYDWLYENGPATANEAAQGLGGLDRGATSCRLSELCTLGVAYETGERVCTVTNMTVIEYDVTELLPTTPKRSPGVSRKQLQTERDWLLKECVRLRMLLDRHGIKY